MPSITGALRLGWILVAWSMCWATHAHAWNATGHALVGQIAYDNLSVAERNAFIELLEKHPRFEADFIDRMPDAIAKGSPVDQGQWLFRQSGSWADKARRYSGNMRRRFHVPRWHYINYPLGIRRDGEPSGPVPETDRRRGLPSDMNVVQAVEAHRVIAKDQTQSPADRALSLTWLCHLVGDLHQLLHTAALFTDRRFPKGDRGGNAISIEGQGSLRNLHALWDNVIGRSVSDRVQIRQAALIAKRFPISALAAPHSTDVGVWTQESVSLSETIAYGTAILAHVSANDHQSGKLVPVKISDDYRAFARKAAEERIALAGYRLAAMLANALASDLDSQ